jgi:DNA-binding NarL/FixJ family response regulator
MEAVASSCLARRQAGARIIIADDHQMFVESLGLVLRRSYDIVGVAHNSAELMDVVSRCEADCALLDIMLPGRNGIECIPAVRGARPSLKILVVTMLLDRGLAIAALDAGAHGFVPKDASVEELVLAINEVLAGRFYVSGRLPKTSHRLNTHSSHPGLHRLTPRQHQIALLLGDGKSESDVARELGLSLSTIAFHKHNLMRTLGLETQAVLTRYLVLLRAAVEESQQSWCEEPPGSG